MAEYERKIVKIKIKKLHDDAIVPDQATKGSSGWDLYADEGMIIHPLMSALVPTGIALEIPDGFEGQIRSRSGWARNEGLIVLNSPGTIDSDYRGEIQVILYNAGQGTISIDQGSKIAQLVITEVPKVEFEVSHLFSDTERGEQGFGSSGYVANVEGDERYHVGDEYTNDGRGINEKKKKATKEITLETLPKS